jgi:uncharacterized membrane protein
MSGGLVLVPEAAVTPVPDMKVDDLLKIYVSLGALTPEVMPGAIAATLPPPPQSEAGRQDRATPPLETAEQVVTVSVR